MPLCNSAWSFDCTQGLLIDRVLRRTRRRRKVNNPMILMTWSRASCFDIYEIVFRGTIEVEANRNET